MKKTIDTINNFKMVVSGEFKEKVSGLIAATPKETVLCENRSKLYRFKNKNVTKTFPLLFVPSMINRYYILDLLSDSSIIKQLVNAGFDTYLIDWDRPSIGDEKNPFEWYVPEFINKSLKKIKYLTGQDKCHLFGYCMGGSLSLIYASLYPEKIQTLGLMATPVDFSKAGIISKWSDKKHFNVNAFIKPYYNIPSGLLHLAFGLIKPSWQIKQIPGFFKILGHKDLLTGYYAVSQWTSDNINIPNLVFKKITEDCYQENKLIKGEMVVDGSIVKLENIKCPVYSIVSEYDFLVPPESSANLKQYLGTKDITEKIYKTGHIGISIGPLAMNIVWKDAVNWLSKHDKSV